MHHLPTTFAALPSIVLLLRISNNTFRHEIQQIGLFLHASAPINAYLVGLQPGAVKPGETLLPVLRAAKQLIREHVEEGRLEEEGRFARVFGPVEDHG